MNSDPEGTSWLSLSTETGLHSANCAADREDLTDTVLGWVVDAPVVVQRQVPWFRQYRIPWSFRSCSSVNRWPMSLLCWFAVAVHRQGLFCLMGISLHFAAFSRSVRMDVSAHFSALDDEEFFVVEGSGWRGRWESDSQGVLSPQFVACAAMSYRERHVISTWSAQVATLLELALRQCETV